MKLNIVSNDPLNILSSTKYVVQNSNHVVLDEQKIRSTTKIIKNFLVQNKDLSEAGVVVTGNTDIDIQLSLIIDSINFCFWAEKGHDKWTVEWPKGSTVGGWYSLLNSFRRALDSETDLSNAGVIADLSFEQAKKIFLGTNGVQMPLLKQRVENLNETGGVLLEKFDGEFKNLLGQSNYDAIDLVKLVLKDFKSFQDKTKFNGKDVFFYKRAQIVAQDINLLLKKKNGELKNIDQLTAFVDYKLPQIFRDMGLLKYSKSLAEKIDNYVLIGKDSKEEIEIRSATVWAVELIRQDLGGKYLASDIDNAVWLISQDQKKVKKPYHRTYTIYY